MNWVTAMLKPPAASIFTPCPASKLTQVRFAMFSTAHSLLVLNRRSLSPAQSNTGRGFSDAISLIQVFGFVPSNVFATPVGENLAASFISALYIWVGKVRARRGWTGIFSIASRPPCLMFSLPFSAVVCHSRICASSASAEFELVNMCPITWSA